jgi:hypothetical protein
MCSNDINQYKASLNLWMVLWLFLPQELSTRPTPFSAFLHLPCSLSLAQKLLKPNVHILKPQMAM